MVDIARLLLFIVDGSVLQMLSFTSNRSYICVSSSAFTVVPEMTLIALPVFYISRLFRTPMFSTASKASVSSLSGTTIPSIASVSSFIVL